MNPVWHNKQTVSRIDLQKLAVWTRGERLKLPQPLYVALVPFSSQSFPRCANPEGYHPIHGGLSNIAPHTRRPLPCNRTHNTAQSNIPGNTVEEEKAAGEDIVQLVQRPDVQVGSARAAATVVDVQHRYWVEFAGSLLEVEIAGVLFLLVIARTSRE